jgi:hypothetical protein
MLNVFYILILAQAAYEPHSREVESQNEKCLNEGLHQGQNIIQRGE